MVTRGHLCIMLGWWPFAVHLGRCSCLSFPRAVVSFLHFYLHLGNTTLRSMAPGRIILRTMWAAVHALLPATHSTMTPPRAFAQTQIPATIQLKNWIPIYPSSSWIFFSQSWTKRNTGPAIKNFTLTTCMVKVSKTICVFFYLDSWRVFH